jgi:hypothetical protein
MQINLRLWTQQMWISGHPFMPKKLAWIIWQLFNEREQHERRIKGGKVANDQRR